ncbi:MAG: hypothetical protein AB7G06_09200 [Bdellovibrionales bacterium]
MSTNASLLNLARNALLTAGHELGADGPHWDVIKSALTGLARSYEALKIEEEVSEQLRIHMKEALDNYEDLLGSFASEIDPRVMEELRNFINELREIYNARFEPVEDDTDLLSDLHALANEIDGMLTPEDAALILNQKRGEG